MQMTCTVLIVKSVKGQDFYFEHSHIHLSLCLCSNNDTCIYILCIGHIEYIYICLQMKAVLFRRKNSSL